jgi:hypothetical protein
VLVYEAVFSASVARVKRKGRGGRDGVERWKEEVMEEETKSVLDLPPLA